MRRQLEQALLGGVGLAREFRLAMLRLCQAELGAGDVDAVERDAVLGWLRGERVPLPALRSALIYGRIGRHNARSLLASLARWLPTVGAAGLVLGLDLSRLAVGRRPPVEERVGVYYSKRGRAGRLRGGPPAHRRHRQPVVGAHGGGGAARAGHRRGARPARLQRAAAPRRRRGARPPTDQPVRSAGATRRPAGGDPDERCAAGRRSGADRQVAARASCGGAAFRRAEPCSRGGPGRSPDRHRGPFRHASGPGPERAIWQRHVRVACSSAAGSAPGRAICSST